MFTVRSGGNFQKPVLKTIVESIHISRIEAAETKEAVEDNVIKEAAKGGVVKEAGVAAKGGEAVLDSLVKDAVLDSRSKKARKALNTIQHRSWKPK